MEAQLVIHFPVSDISFTLTLDADLQATRVASRGLFSKNNERSLTDSARISSTPLCEDFHVYVQVNRRSVCCGQRVPGDVDSYCFTKLVWLSSAGGTRLCQLPQYESGDRADERKREPGAGSVLSKCLGILCEWPIAIASRSTEKQEWAMGDFKQSCNFYLLGITRCTWPRRDYCLSRRRTHAWCFPSNKARLPKNVNSFWIIVCLICLESGNWRKCQNFQILSTIFLSFQVPFTKDCGSDDVCTSDLMLSVQTNTKASR